MNKLSNSPKLSARVCIRLYLNTVGGHFLFLQIWTQYNQRQSHVAIICYCPPLACCDWLAAVVTGDTHVAN